MRNPTVPVDIHLEASPKGGAVLTVKLTNTSAAVVVLNVRNAVDETPVIGQLPTSPRAGQLNELAFVITGTDGKALPFMVDIKRRPLVAEDFQRFEAGQSHEEDIDLARYFGFEAGQRYRVRAVYMNDDDGSRFGVKAWRGLVVSNTLEGVLAR
ncbi:MAG TPA: hypothetical protein VL242_21345 [Sorangium sp.]|uniref:hypothetical protein n=1 Tax=Sorangium sp. So ce1153 TaxID=3133333 RepID=UPI002BEDAB3E|nr:hypothetical protein [Sorangium sp.]